MSKLTSTQKRQRVKCRQELEWDLKDENCPECGVGVLRISKGPLYGRLMNSWFDPCPDGRTKDQVYMAGRHNTTECRVKKQKRAGNRAEYLKYHGKPEYIPRGGGMDEQE
jgi:hypothetical protein